MTHAPSARCAWCGTDPLYVAYHDTEWGVPLTDSADLYAKLILDGFQAGLAWITILRKREAFLRAFEGFAPQRVANFGDDDVARLLADAGIVRSRAKIEAAVSNARIWCELEAGGEGAFSDLLWDCVGGATIVNRRVAMSDLPAATPESELMARRLKKLGWKFGGPTICYAFMQAVGMVNDHSTACFRHAECEAIARR
ncbi:MAG: DNA-3-methyladenine glycosylase I [Myxococcales bacterium]|nr:DNA-3-methyladenine glycosylase I [Myxococcales bacterium]MCB9532433.1 DNA-3-methyladenine glycosylase I [Myxococcales bacterium]MCB9533515.1 DNA-3-methyladenine glycosylase I [Myxococcales bacterium]